MAKAGDPAPEVLEIMGATASFGAQKYAGFSLRTTTGIVNFCLNFERLGFLISRGLTLAQELAAQTKRRAILGGAVVAAEIIPESITVAHQDVKGEVATRIVVIIGDLTLAFKIDQNLAKELGLKLSGPGGPIKQRKTPGIIFPNRGATELKLPTHCTSKSPFDTTELPTKYASYVGFISVLWGNFEARLNDFTEILISANATAIAKWRDQNFRKHRQLFLDEARKAFASHPTILAYCDSLAADSASIHVPRDLLAHGRMSGEVQGEDYILVAEGKHNGKHVVARFKEPELLTLYYDVSNLCGRLGFLLDPDDSPQKPQPFSSSEKQMLRDLIRDNSPTPPTPPTP